MPADPTVSPTTPAGQPESVARTAPDGSASAAAVAPAADPATPIPHEAGHDVHLPEGMTRGPETVRSFRFLLANTLVANVTTSYLWFALTFWAYLQTRSVLATSIVGGSYMLLVAVCSLFFGTLVDHHRKKVAMLTSSGVTLVTYALAAGMYLAFPESTLIDWNRPFFWVFAGVILVGGVVESLRNIALSTCVTLLVPTDERDKANGLVGTVQGVAFMVTSVFSGLSIGMLGMGWTVAIALTLTALAFVHLLTIDIPERDPHTGAASEDRRPAVDLSGAWSAVRVVPGLLALILFATFNNLVGGVFMALMDPYGLTLFSVELWGVLLGLTSIGFIVGGGAVGRFGLGRSPLRTLMVANAVVAVIGLAFTLREWPWLFVVGMFLFMAVMPVAEAAEQTIMQRVVPFRSQGRVQGFAQSLEAVASPVTAFLIGPIAQYGLIPYMNTDVGRDRFGWLVGAGQARGIALVFVIAGLIMVATVAVAVVSRPYRQLGRSYELAGASS